MIVRVDNREGELQMICAQLACASPSITVETAQLPLGDVILCDDSGNDLVIIERKTTNDLAASIKDGRYEEQGFRLDQCEISNHRIFYLIEGRLSEYKPYKGRVERKTLLSSFVSIVHSKGFSLHRTESMDETAEWIIAYADKLGRLKEKPQSYASVSSRAKKSNITADNIMPIMLSQVPGVSVNVAEIIASKYPSWSLLLKALDETPCPLYELTMPTKGGKQRRISKPACDNLRTYLKPVGGV